MSDTVRLAMISLSLPQCDKCGNSLAGIYYQVISSGPPRSGLKDNEKICEECYWNINCPTTIDAHVGYAEAELLENQ